MPIPLTEEQHQLRDTMRDWFSTNYPLSHVRSVTEGKRTPLTLQDLSSLGLSEAFNFTGGSSSESWSFRELGIVAFEVGYAIAPSSIYLRLLGEENLSLQFQDGKLQVVFDAQESRKNIDRSQSFLVNEVSVEPKPTCNYQALAMLANEAAGVCSRCIEMTKEYATTRKQFGKQIGTFQAVQHKLADLFLSTESLRTSAEFAAWSLSNSPAQGALSSAAAATLAGETVAKVVEGCIQLHGGIGFTWEHDLHLFLRRAKVLQMILKIDEARVSTLLDPQYL